MGWGAKKLPKVPSPEKNPVAQMMSVNQGNSITSGAQTGKFVSADNWARRGIIDRQKGADDLHLACQWRKQIDSHVT